MEEPAVRSDAIYWRRVHRSSRSRQHDDGGEDAVPAKQEPKHEEVESSGPGAAVAASTGEEETRTQERAQQGVRYVFQGVRYACFEEFLAAVEARPATPQKLSMDIVAKRVRALFHQFAGSVQALEMPEFKGLAASVAAELGMDPRKFGDLSATFDRFDVNGDGFLDEEECVMLAESMLRYYLDAAAPRVAGQVNMINLELKRPEDHYLILQKLGQGGQGAVYLARERQTGHQRVIKCHNKGNVNAPLEEIKEEFRLLRSLDHPRIQRLYDIFEDRANVYIVSEPYYGGHMGHLVEKALDAGVNVTSVYLAKVMYQVLQGVAYMHSQYVTHCDLKESNVMVATDTDWYEPSVVVIDFGLAHNFIALGTCGGTPGYMPPEVWQRGRWTPKGDVHALGVVLFNLFSNGERCFDGWGDAALMHSTINAPPKLHAISYNWRRCVELPPLLEAMLRKDPRERPTAKECLQHDFFTKRVRPPSDEEAPEEAIPSEVLATLAALGERTELQQAVLTDIAAQTNLASLRELNATFNAMDSDGNGVLTAEEVRTALTGRLDEGNLEQVVQRLVGPDGRIAYTSFMGRLLAAKAADENRLLWREFQQLDHEGTGYLDRNRIARLLERPALKEVLGGRGPAELMALMDADGDGRVVFEEFQRALAGGLVTEVNS